MSLQMSFEICGGIFSLVCIGILTAMRGFDRDRARWLIALFSSCSAFCFLSAQSEFFDGDQSTAGFFLVRISVFLTWFFCYMTTALEVFYVKEYLMGYLETGKDDTRDNILRDRISYGAYISLGICGVGVFLLMISQIFHIFYYFDDAGYYTSLAPAFILYAVPVISTVPFFILLIPFFKRIPDRGIFIIVFSFILTVLAAVAGFFIKEIPFFMIAFLTAGILFFVGCIRDCIRAVQKKEETIAQKDAAITEQRARIMQSQIRPHFIFNSLLAIKQLCLEEPKKASDALQHFSTFLRANLESLTDEKPVPIAREIECIKEYVALEQSDPSGRFTVNYDIAYNDFKVPLLSVEPMVENAIRHGVASKKSGGVVTIRTFLEGENAVVTVEDNGSGFGSETAQQAHHRSIGIQNVRDRLSLICGGELSIVNTGNGTIVRMTIPKESGGNEE